MRFKQYYNLHDNNNLEKKSAPYIPKKKKIKPRLRNKKRGK